MLEQDKQRGDTGATTTQNKPPEVCDSYFQHSFLDARDAEGEWRLGYVIDRNEKTRYYKVRFDGWQAKWDEYYLFSSPKLRHLRTMTQGYTGQKVHPAIRTGWKFQLKQHDENYQRIRQFQQQPQSIASPIAVTQLLRGTHYIYIDFLLSSTFESGEELQQVVAYLRNHLDLVREYLSTLDTSFEKYYRSQEIKEESIVVDRQSALVCSFYELLDSCVSVFGGYPRLNSFYKDNKTLLYEFFKHTEAGELSTDEMIRRCFCTYLQECGLWEQLKKLVQRLMEETHILPFPFLKVLTSLFCQLDRLLEKELVRPYPEYLLQIFKRNFDRLTDKQIKDLDRSTISQVISQLKLLYANSGAKYKVQMELEYLDLELAYRYFKSPFFEKKLKGITSLKDQLELIGRGKENMVPYDFFEWTQKNNFLQDVFGDGMHQELLKRAYEVLKLFCQHRLMSRDVLDMIWGSRAGKHEAVIKTIDDTIVELVNQMPGDLIIYLFDLIQQQPLKNWDDQFLDLVKRYSQNAVRTNKCRQHKFGLDLIYEFATKRQDEKSISAFFELLKLQAFEDQLKQYRDICLEKIRLGVSSYLHVLLLLRIEKELNVNIFGKSNIVDILVNDILREARHVEQLPTRFTLLYTMLYYHQTLSLDPKQFDKLWELFKILEHPGEAIFMNWLCKQEEGEYKISTVLDETIRGYIFKEALCNPKKNDFIGMELSQCEVFLSFMRDVNIYGGQLVKFKSTAVCLVNKPELTGMQQLWQLFLNNKREEVTSRVADAICDYTIRLSAKMQAEVGQEPTIRLVNRCLELISSGSQKQNYRLVSNCVMLLLRLMDKTEGKFQYTPTHKQQQAGSYDITIINTKTNEKKSIAFNYTLPIGCLRKIIAKDFGIATNAFQLSSKSTAVTFDFDQITFFESGLIQPLYLAPIEPEPSAVKTEVNKSLDMLFSLLSTECSDGVWQLLSQLPISPQFKETIEKAQSWEELISGGVYRELYILRVVETMDREEWLREFVEKSGAKTLLNKLRQDFQLRTEVDAEYLSTLTRLLLRHYENQSYANDETSDMLVCLVEALITALSKLCRSVRTQKPANHEQSQQRTQFQRQAAQNICKLLLILQRDERVGLLQSLLESGRLEFLLSTGLTTSVNRKFREIVFINVAKMLTESDSEREGQHIQQIMVVALTSTLNEAIQLKEGVGLFFSFASSMLDKLEINVARAVLTKLPTLLDKLCNLIFTLSPEKSARQFEELLWGSIHLTRIIINRKGLTEELNNDKLLSYLLEVCLFAVRPESKQPKCKTYKTRLVTFRLVMTLMWLHPKNTEETLSFLSQFHLAGKWRNKRLGDWQITPKMNEKSITGYVGIKNLGCICYMNSFLQQMFMIPSFREAVFAVEDPLFEKVKQEDNLLYQLKTLFIALQKSEQQYYNPRNFCHAFKDYQGKPINTSEQMDIDEFSGVIFDRLENQVKGVALQNFIKDHFGGVISNEIISKGCTHYSERQQPFLSIPLQVKNKKDIYQSLQTMIKGEMLEGDNAYHCDRCNKKVPALKRMSLKRLPNHLILVLKRFEFNYENMTKHKINDYCEFPRELNLKDYSQQHLRSKQKDAKIDEQETILPDEYYSYELKGVVIHMGSADSGHYYSYIQKRGGNEGWFDFNDTFVRKFDADNLASQAFGGKQQRYYESTLKEKTRNAYVLIYDRKQCFNSKGESIRQMELQSNREETPYCQTFLKELRVENELTALHHLLFARQYQEFLMECLANRQKFPENCQLPLNKFATLFLLTRSIREKQKKPAFELAALLKEQFYSCQRYWDWTMDVFNDQCTLVELIKNNPSKDMRKLLANMIVEVCSLAYPLEGEGVNNRLFETEDSIDNPHPKTSLANLINLILRLANEKYVACSNELMMILTKLSLMGCEISDYLLEKRTVTLLLENFMDRDASVSASSKMIFHVRPDKKLIGTANESELNDSRFELLALRKTKLDLDRSYFWYLLTQLIRHCDLKKKGSYPQYFYETKHLLEKEQLSLIFLSPALIYKALEDARTKLLMRKVSEYLVLLAIEDPKFSDEVMKCIGKALKALESTKFRPFFVLFKYLVAIPDHLQEKRLEGVSQLKIGLQQNKKYFVETDIIQQWLLKTSRKNRKLRDYLRAEVQLVRSILNYMKEKQSPSEQLARKNLPPCDRLLHMLHGVQIPKSSSAYFDLTKMKIHEYTAILAGQQIQTKLGDPEWDSDDDLTTVPVKAGDTVTIYLETPRSTFEQAHVESEVYGRLELKVASRQQHTFIWKDEELLAPVHRIVNVDELRRVVVDSQSDETASIGDDDDSPHVI